MAALSRYAVLLPRGGTSRTHRGGFQRSGRSCHSRMVCGTTDRSTCDRSGYVRDAEKEPLFWGHPSPEKKEI